MPGDTPARSVSDLLRWGLRRGHPSVSVPPPPASPEVHTVFPSRLLPKFLAALSRDTGPSLVDLGPVIGTNITFLGERLGCKIFVEDVFAEIQRRVRQGTTDELAAFLDQRFGGRAASVDGVLCWDVFDYLDRQAAHVLATRLVEMLRPGGAVLGFFGTTDVDHGHYTKFVIIDETRLQHRPYPASDTRRRVLQNRDIIRLFEGLQVAEQVLLKINTREILFRKP